MSRRRGSGEGTIRLRKKGGYEARLTLDDGSRRSIYGQSYEEVRRKLAAAVRDRDDGALMLGDARQTVGKYLVSWLHITKATVRRAPTSPTRATFACISSRLLGGCVSRI